jgi:hypothetical protein
VAITQRDIGDGVRLTGTFTDIAGAAADPTAVTFRMKEPDDTVTVYVYLTDGELVKDSTGVYHVDWTLLQDGDHYWRMEGTGAVIAAAEGYVRVRNSQILP